MGSTILKIILPMIAFLMFANIFISLFTSVFDLASGKYFDDYKNYISLENKEKFMEIDTLLFLGTRKRNSSGTIKTFIIEAKSEKNKNRVEFSMQNENYFNYKSKFVAYKSKLTKRYFLKNAPDAYFDSEYFSVYSGLYFKISFFPLLGFVIYLFVNYKKSL